MDIFKEDEDDQNYKKRRGVKLFKVLLSFVPFLLFCLDGIWYTTIGLLLAFFVYKERRSLRLIMALFGGSLPLLLSLEGIWYRSIGLLLVFFVWIISLTLEEHGFIEGVMTSKVPFLFSFMILSWLSFFRCSSSIASYLIPILICAFGLWMPLDFLMKDPRNGRK